MQQNDDATHYEEECTMMIDDKLHQHVVECDEEFAHMVYARNF